MNLIVIKSANSSVRSITKRDGTKISFVEQVAAIDCGDEFPRPFRLNLAEDQKPYPPGHYYIDPASFIVNKYDGLEIGRRVVLSPMPVPAQAK